MTQRDLVLWLAERMLLLPYRWGGDDPIAGFDCSGLVIECLRSAGLLPRDGDWTAAALRDLFAGPGRERDIPPSRALPAGALVFWGSPRITHVELVWRVLDDGTVLTIGAAGGGSATVDAAAAERQNAYVKVRPLRSGWVVAVDPF
jgi:hypothetical protein